MIAHITFLNPAIYAGYVEVRRVLCQQCRYLLLSNSVRELDQTDAQRFALAGRREHDRLL